MKPRSFFIRRLAAVIIIFLLVHTGAISQNLVVRGEYRSAPFIKKSIIILPILDSIQMPTKNFGLLTIEFGDRESNTDLRTGLYRFLPEKLSAVSPNHFAFLDLDYSRVLTPKATSIEKDKSLGFTNIYYPGPREKFPAIADTVDFIIIFYGLGFENMERVSSLQYGGAYALGIGTFKGRMYAHGLIWDHRQSKIAANGRISVDATIVNKTIQAEAFQKMLEDFAGKFIERTPWARDYK